MSSCRRYLVSKEISKWRLLLDFPLKFVSTTILSFHDKLLDLKMVIFFLKVNMKKIYNKKTTKSAVLGNIYLTQVSEIWKKKI